MDTGVGWVIPLAQAADHDERWIGGKAAKPAELARAPVAAENVHRMRSGMGPEAAARVWVSPGSR